MAARASAVNLLETSNTSLVRRRSPQSCPAAARPPAISPSSRRRPTLRSCTRTQNHESRVLQAGVDTSVIALWLGHADVRSTQPYLHADLTIKEKALALLTPATVTPGRYKPPDALLAFLEDL